MQWDEAPSSVAVGTTSGACEIAVPSGPYAIEVDSTSGGIDVDPGLVDPYAERSIRISASSGAVSVRQG